MKKNLLALAVSLAAGSVAVAQQTRSNHASDAAAYGIFSQGLAPQPDDDDRDGSLEKYATTSTGVDLYWTAFVPEDGMRHPAVLVLHPGGFKTGRAGPAIVAKNMSKAGFLGLATEYRLAPLHGPMNSPRHPVYGQDDVSPVDDGHYPEQTMDVQMAIRTARADPRCDGRVYCLGGSAEASPALYMAASGTAGDDRPSSGNRTDDH